MSDDPTGANRYVYQAYLLASDYMVQLTGIRPTLTSAFRSGAEQVRLWENRANNPYPVNRPGDSAHNVKFSALGPGSLAIDSWVPDRTVTINGHQFNSRDVWTYLRQYVGFRVPSNDVVHSEIPDWRKYSPRF